MGDMHIREWAYVRQRELIEIPGRLAIHPDFLGGMDAAAFEAGFRAAWQLFHTIYGAVALRPEEYGMPLFRVDEYAYGSQQARASRNAPWRPVDLIYHIAICGTLEGDGLTVPTDVLIAREPPKPLAPLMKLLGDCGFAFEGLKGVKPVRGGSFSVRYPADMRVVPVLALMARKAANIGRDLSANRFCDDFAALNYRLLGDGFGDASYGDGPEYVADRFHARAERDTANAFDALMMERGLFRAREGWNEGPALSYYDKETTKKRKGPYLYRLTSWKGEPRLLLRIRNPEAALKYMAGLPDGGPEEIRAMFRRNDAGCHLSAEGRCKGGVHYEFEGVRRRKCACCAPGFWLTPVEENIGHYARLVELGEKKRVGEKG